MASLLMRQMSTVGDIPLGVTCEIEFEENYLHKMRQTQHVFLIKNIGIYCRKSKQILLFLP